MAEMAEKAEKENFCPSPPSLPSPPSPPRRIAVMPRILATATVLTWLLCAPAPLQAQAKDAFVRGLIELTQAVNGVDGRDDAAVRAALDAMAKGLAEWDAAVARVEGGFRGAITGAAPPAAARMRGTLAATYLERGRVADALIHLDRAATLDPS